MLPAAAMNTTPFLLMRSMAAPTAPSCGPEKLMLTMWTSSWSSQSSAESRRTVSVDALPLTSLRNALASRNVASGTSPGVPLWGFPASSERTAVPCQS